MNKNVILTALICISFSGAAFAADYNAEGAAAHGPWQFRLRTIGVLSESGGNSTIGGTPNAGNDVVPEIDVSYFFTKNIAAELIVATSKHDIDLNNSDLGDLDLGDSWILPPTLTLQYHFTPSSKFSPYLGAGINYTLPYAENNGSDVASLEIDGSFGWALQMGADYWVNDNWGFNVDVKKIFVDVDASVNSGAVNGSVELDPWVVGAGVSYRF